MEITARPHRHPAATWALSVTPWGALLALVTFALHVRVGLGHWPEPMVEDYATPLARAHEYTMVALVLFAMLLAVPVGAVLACWRRFRLPVHIHVLQLAVFVAGWGAIVLVGQLDPTSFTEWLLD